MSPAEGSDGDAAARRLSQQAFDGVLVVEAGAGTGKTAILIARIVAFSLGPGWERAVERFSAHQAHAPAPEEIAAQVLGRVAAITFTEAAAAEMAQRAGAAFAEIAGGGTPKGVHEPALPALPAERALRARALVGALDHLQVRTIHAFCRGVLAQFPLEAGIHPGFQVDADGLVQAEVVREIVEAAVSVAYADTIESPLLRLALADIGPTQVETAVAELVAAGVSPEVLSVDPFAPERFSREIAILAAAAAAFEAAGGGRLATAKRGKAAVVACAAVAATRSLVDAAGGVSDEPVAKFLESLRAVWSDGALARLKLWGLGTFTGGESDAAAGEEDAIRRTAAALADVAGHLRKLDPQRVEDARQALQPLLTAVEIELRRRGAATYGSLLRDTRDLLVGHDDVGRRLRGDLDQLLVDEFQDTDPLQCEIIRAIALTGPAETRPGLFLVGDPKQSIYGWRNADLAAYDGFLAEVLGAGREPARLSRNFRSLPGILTEVEHALKPVMRREEGVQPEFQPLVPDRADVAGAEPPVEYWVSWGRDEAGGPARTTAALANAHEAEAIARDLSDRHARGELDWKDAGILFRSGGDLETYLRALREAGVPYAVERDRSYFRRREIIEASALVRCVLDRNDVLALVAWLRSAGVGVPDAALLPLWKRGFPRLVAHLPGDAAATLAALDDAITAAAAEISPDIPGIERVRGWDASLRQALAAIAHLRASFQRDACDVFVEKLRNLTLFEASEAARYLGAYRVANLDRFFRDLVVELASVGDQETLLRRLRTGVMEAHEAEEARPSSADDAVRVMTIHKAKGLDFRHTYVVQLRKRPGGGRGSPPAEVAVLGGVPEYRLFGAATPNFRGVLAQRARVEAAERIRSLYVAMTRARDRLVLLGNWPEAVAPVAAEAAASHLDLLASRAPGIPDLAAHMRELAAAGGDRFDACESRWVFPSLRPALGVPGGRSRAESAGDAEAPARAAAQALQADREQARARAARPWRAVPSADAHVEDREIRARRRFSEASGDSGVHADAVARGAARVAGTVVHRILEDFDLSAEPAAELARQRAGVSQRVAALAGEHERQATEARVHATLDVLERGELLNRLCGLADGVAARELPVLLPTEAEGDGPVGFVAGSIDLVYRDPGSGAWVVVDYKTDSLTTEEEISECATRYAGQGRVYQRAVREALGLDVDPRFELWLLAADRVLVVA